MSTVTEQVVCRFMGAVVCLLALLVFAAFSMLADLQSLSPAHAGAVGWLLVTSHSLYTLVGFVVAWIGLGAGFKLIRKGLAA